MTNSEELLKLLRQMPVFGGLKNSTLSFILEQSGTVEVAADEHFFLEGEAAQSFFVLRAGSIVIEKEWEGTQIAIGQLGEGDCFGEMAIIDLQTRSASVRAESDCRAVEITRKTLHELYRQDLEQYAIIMMNMGREVSRRLRVAGERLFAIDQSIPG